MSLKYLVTFTANSDADFGFDADCGKRKIMLMIMTNISIMRVLIITTATIMPRLRMMRLFLEELVIDCDLCFYFFSFRHRLVHHVVQVCSPSWPATNNWSVCQAVIQLARQSVSHSVIYLCIAFFIACVCVFKVFFLENNNNIWRESGTGKIFIK